MLDRIEIIMTISFLLFLCILAIMYWRQKKKDEENWVLECRRMKNSDAAAKLTESERIASLNDKDFFNEMIRSRNDISIEYYEKIYINNPSISSGSRIYLGKIKSSNETADEFYARIRSAYNRGGLVEINGTGLYDFLVQSC